MIQNDGSSATLCEAFKCEALDFKFCAQDEIKLARVTVPVPANERARIEVLRQSVLLDTPVESIYDRYSSLAARFFKVPMAFVVLIDVDRAFLKSRIGFCATECPRDDALCSYVVLEDTPKVMVVHDATKDARFCNSPLVLADGGTRFYAGYGLEVEGVKLGSFCVVDGKPRPDFSEEDASILQSMGKIVEDLIIARRKKVLGVENDLARLISLVLSDLQAPIQSLQRSARLLEPSFRNEKLPVQEVEAFRHSVQRLEDNIERQLELAISLTSPSGTSTTTPALYPAVSQRFCADDQQFIYAKENWLQALLGNEVECQGDSSKGKTSKGGLLLQKGAYRLVYLLLPLLLAHCKQQNGLMEVWDEAIKASSTGDSSQGEVKVHMLFSAKSCNNQEKCVQFEQYILTLLQGVKIGGMKVYRHDKAATKGIVIAFPCLFPVSVPSPSPRQTHTLESSKNFEGLCMWKRRTVNQTSGLCLLKLLWPFPSLRHIRSSNSLVHPYPNLDCPVPFNVHNPQDSKTPHLSPVLSPSLDSVDGVMRSKEKRRDKLDFTIANTIAVPTWDSES